MEPLPVKHLRSNTLMYGAGALFVIAAMSQARLQIVERDQTMERAKKTNHLSLSRKDYARRGTILAADGKPLAEDADAYELSLQYNKVPETDAFYMALSQASGIPASEFAQLNNGKIAIWPEPISAEQKQAIEKVKTEWRADGVSLRRVERRQYPLGEQAATPVGVYRDGSILGMERYFNADLKGQDGMTVGMVDRTGAFLPMRMQASDKVNGRTILTTLDSDLQMAAATAVREAVDKNKATNGVALVMNPKTGDVLAMASWPTFDPNRTINSAGATIGRTQVNPNGQLQFEPGSTFKILTIAKALDLGVVTPTDTFHCSGQMEVGSKLIHCDNHHGNRAHGTITPELAIAKSCNLAAATWALRIGREDMIKYIEDLGLLTKTNVGIPGEVTGRFRKDEYAKRLQLATVGFGQSITTTPISLISAFCTIANDGVRMKPRMIQKIGDKMVPVQQLGRLLKPETCHTVMGFMESVIETDAGTGKGLRIKGYRLGGKTGTAQKVNHKETGYVSNFVGFIPAEQPKAVILVMVNNPTNGEYYGAAVAGPVFVKVAHAVIDRLHIPKDAPMVAQQIRPEPQPIVEAPKAQASRQLPAKSSMDADERVAAKSEPARKSPTLKAEGGHGGSHAAILSSLFPLRGGPVFDRTERGHELAPRSHIPGSEPVLEVRTGE